MKKLCNFTEVLIGAKGDPNGTPLTEAKRRRGRLPVMAIPQRVPKLRGGQLKRRTDVDLLNAITFNSKLTITMQNKFVMEIIYLSNLQARLIYTSLISSKSSGPSGPKRTEKSFQICIVVLFVESLHLVDKIRAMLASKKSPPYLISQPPPMPSPTWTCAGSWSTRPLL